jgi:hypothetical protein
MIGPKDGPLFLYKPRKNSDASFSRLELPTMPSDLSTGDWIEIFVGGTLLVAFAVCVRWIGWRRYWRDADPTLDWWKRPRSFFRPVQWIRDFRNRKSPTKLKP